MKKGLIALAAVCLLTLTVKAADIYGQQDVQVKTLLGKPDSVSVLLQPEGVVSDQHGALYIADTGNSVIRQTADDKTTIFAGVTVSRDAYGLAAQGRRDGAAKQARFYAPTRMAVGADGEDMLYISDSGNNCIRRISDGDVDTLCGFVVPGYAEDCGSAARFNAPGGITPDGTGGIYVADTLNHCIRRVTSAGETFLVAGHPGKSGYQDGTTGEAYFNEPTALCVGSDGAIYVTDSGNQRIRRIASGKVTTFSGGGDDKEPDSPYYAGGFADGTANEARFRFPQGICAGENGLLYVADTWNHAIRQIDPTGRVTTLAGGSNAGFADGDGKNALFNAPYDLCMNNGKLIVADMLNSAVREIQLKP